MRLLDQVRVLAQLQRGIWMRYGWLESWRQRRPVDREGNPLPWLSYPAIDFLSQFDFTGCRVFEWGSGNSTLWWARRGAKVTSVESNQQWVPHFRAQVPSSVDYIITPFDVDAEIAAFTGQPGRFDVIVIDNHGPFRWRCSEVAPGKLAEGGVIILDNSDQCLKAWQILCDQGLTPIDFAGFAPSCGYAQTTSVFFRNLRLRRAAGDQPVRSAAQPNPPWERC